ncbi:hypothetical protein CBR_g263 [Chara braunii]|uniref:Anamorsin homolog n=1 Tax=Chara braunii TaxID=69332 RepID=A0A388JM29_CHABU|nr:hypothetical protein CBR_g263 [Chara braunii]|eukprot:GBG58864.1 hypothetical protein CBR_g263 [Chara braunii]
MEDARRHGLVLTSAQVLTGRIVSSFQADSRVGLNDISVVTNSSSQQGMKLALESSSVDVILSVAEVPGHHTAPLLSEFNRVLRSGGEVTIQEPCCRRSPVGAESTRLGTLAGSLQSKEGLERALTLSGFIQSQALDPLLEVGLSSRFVGVTDASVGSSYGPLLVPLAVKARKPQWETGTSFSLRRPVKGTVAGPVKLSVDDLSELAPSTNGVNGSHKGGSSVVQISMQNNDDELIDEDELLDDDEADQPSIEAPANDDCEVGSGGVRKACKNCTCGRAEQEAKGVKPVLTKDMLENPQSNCGNCGLGDAFRCGGCPYRGLPPFKPGEKIVLPENFLGEVV